MAAKIPRVSVVVLALCCTTSALPTSKRAHVKEFQGDTDELSRQSLERIDDELKQLVHALESEIRIPESSVELGDELPPAATSRHPRSSPSSAAMAHQKLRRGLYKSLEREEWFGDVMAWAVGPVFDIVNAPPAVRTIIIEKADEKFEELPVVKAVSAVGKVVVEEIGQLLDKAVSALSAKLLGWDPRKVPEAVEYSSSITTKKSKIGSLETGLTAMQGDIVASYEHENVGPFPGSKPNPAPGPARPKPPPGSKQLVGYYWSHLGYWDGYTYKGQYTLNGCANLCTADNSCLGFSRPKATNAKCYHYYSSTTWTINPNHGGAPTNDDAYRKILPALERDTHVPFYKMQRGTCHGKTLAVQEKSRCLELERRAATNKHEEQEMERLIQHIGAHGLDITDLEVEEVDKFMITSGSKEAILKSKKIQRDVKKLAKIVKDGGDKSLPHLQKLVRKAMKDFKEVRMPLEKEVKTRNLERKELERLKIYAGMSMERREEHDLERRERRERMDKGMMVMAKAFMTEEVAGLSALNKADEEANGDNGDDWAICISIGLGFSAQFVIGVNAGGGFRICIGPSGLSELERASDEMQGLERSEDQDEIWSAAVDRVLEREVALTAGDLTKMVDFYLFAGGGMSIGIPAAGVGVSFGVDYVFDKYSAGDCWGMYNSLEAGVKAMGAVTASLAFGFPMNPDWSKATVTGTALGALPGVAFFISDLTSVGVSINVGVGVSIIGASLQLDAGFEYVWHQDVRSAAMGK